MIGFHIENHDSSNTNKHFGSLTLWDVGQRMALQTSILRWVALFLTRILTNKNRQNSRSEKKNIPQTIFKKHYLIMAPLWEIVPFSFFFYSKYSSPKKFTGHPLAELVLLFQRGISPCCSWKKSCATWEVQNHVNNGISTISTAGFLPSTVSLEMVPFCSDSFPLP